MSLNKNYTALPAAFLNGFYALFFYGSLNRELMARFGDSIEVAVGGLLFFMLWIIIGGVGFRIKQYPTLAGVISVAMLPLTAVISTAVTMSFPTPGLHYNLGTFILAAGAGSMLFGLNSGIACTFNRAAGKDHYISWLAGTVTGAIFYHFLHKTPGAEIVLLFGSSFLLLMAFCLKRFSLATRIGLAVGALAILLMTGWLWENQRFFFRRNLFQGRPVKSVELADGRYSVVADNVRRRHEFSIYKNTLLIGKVPDDCGEYSAAAIFSAMQHETRQRQRVLLVSSPFTKVPLLLLGLPNVESVDLLCANRNIGMLAVYNGILPPLFERFKIITRPGRTLLPVRAIGASRAKYDLVMIFDNSAEVALTPYYLKQFKAVLNKGGVLTVGIRKQRKHRKHIKQLMTNLGKIFREVKLMNGNPLLIAAGDKGITVSPTELDRRFAVNSSLPTGAMEALYAVFEMTSGEPEEKAIEQPRFTLLPAIGFSPWLTMPILLILYFVLKFFVARRDNYGIVFTAGENGFFATAFLIITAFYFQSFCGMFYSRGILLVATLTAGIAFGLLLAEWLPKIVQILTLFSIMLPGALFLFNLPSAGQYPIEFIITPLLTFAGILTGCCHAVLRKKVTLINSNRLPLFEVTGGVFAILVALSHEFFSLNLSGVIVVLAAVRFITAGAIVKTRKNS